MGVVGMCTSKTLLGFLGVVFFISGIASIAIGSMIINRYYSTVKNIENFSLLQVPAVLLIFIGLIFFLAGIAGCCNLFRESKACLVSFFVFLFVLASLMIVAASLGSVYRDDINHTLKSSLNLTLHKYNESEATRRQMDDLQTLFKCCGVDNYTDWGENVPSSCLRTGKHVDMTETSDFFTTGCFTKVKAFFDSNFGYIVGGSVGLLVILVLGMIGSCALFCYKRNENYFTLS